MDHTTLQTILTRHAAWLRGDPDGVRADLTGADLRGAILRDARGFPDVPRIPCLDTAILAQIEVRNGLLEMSSWHTCATTHCRAGWAITLAGEAGKALEDAYGPAVAGALLYAAAYPDRPVPNFYASNDAALEDIRASAAREQGASS